MPTRADIDVLADQFALGGVAILTGAGCSTASGIPDYRGPGTRRRAANPVQYRAFLGDPVARRRYWARSMVGWPRFEAAGPNAAHETLRRLESEGRCAGLVTQNVDGLHQRAGHPSVIELHGNLAQVRCLTCQSLTPRESLQRTLTRLNPWWTATSAELAPDGDAHVDVDERFTVPGCAACGEGILKPDVVFFGESVPRARVEAATAIVDAARSLLVVGSSLAVFSGLRFVRRAHERNIPVTILTQGETRGDRWASHLIQGRCEAILPACAAHLGVSASPDPPP